MHPVATLGTVYREQDSIHNHSQTERPTLLWIHLYNEWGGRERWGRGEAKQHTQKGFSLFYRNFFFLQSLFDVHCAARRFKKKINPKPWISSAASAFIWISVSLNIFVCGLGIVKNICKNLTNTIHTQEQTTAFRDKSVKDSWGATFVWDWQ